MDTAAIPPALPSPPSRREAMMAKAEEMEAAFLAEMLAHAGLRAREGSFGGTEGEAQFTSFLRQEQARQMVESGGIGLAELIFNAMAKAEEGVTDAERA